MNRDRPNQRAAGDGGTALRLQLERHCPPAPEHGRSVQTCAHSHQPPPWEQERRDRSWTTDFPDLHG
jgi:hypothetical protein